ncbi:site-specific integrase [Streptomyces sp. NPDC056653]|uniref:site-specific integrase n=1 Tax=Streptomyces sp. NPDC056653 TaxID=3345894 RepID=UPI0036A6C858
MDDGVIQRNPCRIKGAGAGKTAERPFLEVTEFFQLPEAVPVRFRVFILLPAFTGLRFGELAALQRRDVDLERRTVSVRRALAETRADGLLIKAPESAACVRTVALPASLKAELTSHLDKHAESNRTGLDFTGARGGRLRRNNFRRIWLRTVEKARLGDVHFHDLRHTGNTLAATGGATTRELMQRMGALVGPGRADLSAPGQRAGPCDRRPRRCADQKGPPGRTLRAGFGEGIRHVSGTTPLPHRKRGGTIKSQAAGLLPVTWAFAVLPAGGRGRFRTADICFVSSIAPRHCLGATRPGWPRRTA